MSQMGQTRTLADVCDTTASPLEADMTRSPRDVADGPIPDSCTAAKPSPIARRRPPSHQFETAVA